MGKAQIFIFRHKLYQICLEVHFLKSFPLPLTASEEQYYLQKYTEGDLNAKHILIEHNLRQSGYSLPGNHPPDIFEDNIFPGIWTKVFERPSNRYLEGDFYIVYVRDKVLVLFQEILSFFTISSKRNYHPCRLRCLFF